MWRRGRRRQDQTKKEEVPEEQKAAAGPTAQNKGVPAWAWPLHARWQQQASKRQADGCSAGPSIWLLALTRRGRVQKSWKKKTEITVNF
ncbi:hypothetical protein GQ55_3G096800 [Panicum hallii var. hallii]|uniref:Uncharacterized protein n=1 Tax=Panicum hallii var. hallii TaxID=1504633 RepID=A0A2T7E7K6_9POAL|nr:hypothetical protein GQ55_3G096800 [Panicum hallii var. hallii]